AWESRWRLYDICCARLQCVRDKTAMRRTSDGKTEPMHNTWGNVLMGRNQRQ
ncbi:hypothetical protein ACLOJK_029651, partial [Asimina triloba]